MEAGASHLKPRDTGVTFGPLPQVALCEAREAVAAVPVVSKRCPVRTTFESPPVRGFLVLQGVPGIARTGLKAEYEHERFIDRAELVCLESSGG
jgi:hypothetical protein